MAILEFVTITREEFSHYRASIRQASFSQSVEMADLLQANGWDVAFVAVKSTNDKQIMAAALIRAKKMTGGQHFEVKYGPLYQVYNQAVNDFFYAHLKKYTEIQGAIELVITPDRNYQAFDDKGQAMTAPDKQSIEALKQLGYNHEGLQTGYRDGEANWFFLKSLSELADETALLNSYNSNAKRNIKKALKAGVSIKQATYEDLEAVSRLIEHTGERQHFETHPLSYYQRFYQAFGSQAIFLTAYHEEKAVAAGLFIETGSEFVYLFGGSDAAFSKLGAAFLLQHAAMLEAKARNLDTYNFYGIAGLFDGSDGVLRFKQNFGGYIEQKVGRFTYYPHPAKYAFLQALKRIVGR